MCVLAQLELLQGKELDILLDLTVACIWCFPSLNLNKTKCVCEISSKFFISLKDLLMLFASHAPEHFVFVSHLSNSFDFAEMCGSLLWGCFLEWNRSPYRVAEKSPDANPENTTCGCLRHICRIALVLPKCVEACCAVVSWDGADHRIEL